MEEYKAEELQGKMSRFKNKFIKPIVMLDKENKIVGMVRAISMGPDFIYLADEVIDQEIVELHEFDGNVQQQKQQRELFLLAYLFLNACGYYLSTYSHLMIIAANGREKLYSDVGFEAFPMSLEKSYFPKHLKDIKVLMKLGSPGPALINSQQKIKSLPMPTPTNTTSWQQSAVYAGSAVGLLAVAGLFAFQGWERTAKYAADFVRSRPKL